MTLDVTVCYTLDMIRKTKFVSGEFYHIYNRGNSKQKIFLDFEDYYRFEKLLYLCNGKKRFNYYDNFQRGKMEPFDFERGERLVDICSYVLMPNHFHLLIYINNSEKDLKDFLRKLQMSYSKYFNTKYKRIGILWEGNFKAEHVDNDNYLKYIFSYIHLNPIKLIQSDWKEKGVKDYKKAKDFLNKYTYSSFSYFSNISEQKEIVKKYKLLNSDIFLHLVQSSVNLQNEVFSWLKLKP